MSTAFRDAVDETYHNKKKKNKKQRQRGENGCLEYTDFGIGSDILALSQMVRGGNPLATLGIDTDIDVTTVNVV